MRILVVALLIFSFNLANADSSAKGLYKVNVKTKSGKNISGYVDLIDSNNILSPITIKGSKLKYEF